LKVKVLIVQKCLSKGDQNYPKVKEGWPRAYQKEIKTQIDSKSFALDVPNEGEHIIPEMEIN